mmetsp:Transcript_4245/g.10277  ORF Transcript_4245/g.10277 Transcript_4245/m.10277 type:complete len:398 (-) Transcript_4245:704-1897(-)
MSSIGSEQVNALASSLIVALASAARNTAPLLERRLRVHTATATAYESIQLQSKARSVIPTDRLRREAKEAAELSADLGEDPAADELDVLAELLLHWFKKEFFKWVNSPPCDFCGSPTQIAGMVQPSSEDLRHGASRVELHRCKTCGRGTRFPRYNDPGKLLDTRRGRCGEWANCFTLCCRAMGLDARIVFDWTDHVWTEYFSPAKGRWVHLDPCEAAYDKPLLYEAGWGKKLSYAIAFSKDSVTDVTRRYTSDFASLVPRRTEAPEPVVLALTAVLTQGLRRGMGAEQLQALHRRDLAEAEELAGGPAAPRGPLPGRQTGTEEWRRARGEMGSAGGKDGTAAPKQLARTGTRFMPANDGEALAHEPRRIRGGFVCASGHNAPEETVVRAFDGNSSTK